VLPEHGDGNHARVRVVRSGEEEARVRRRRSDAHCQSARKPERIYVAWLATRVVHRSGLLCNINDELARGPTLYDRTQDIIGSRKLASAYHCRVFAVVGSECQ
jgi:hypothetical protein